MKNKSGNIESTKRNGRKKLISAIKKHNATWITLIFVLSFALSGTFSLASENILESSSIYAAIFLIIPIVFINILLDTIGTSATAASETRFHAMAARKQYAARQAIWLIKNAAKVSTICNDVIGDICGIVSGTASAYVIIALSSKTEAAALIVTGALAALTVGGKAIGKLIAIHKGNQVIYNTAIVIKFLHTQKKSFRKFFRKFT